VTSLEHTSRHLSGDLSDESRPGAGRRFGLAASRFNGELVDKLLQGATDCLIRHGVAEKDLRVARVPGAFELPLALAELAQSGGLDGLVALAVVIRGETPHFDYVCAEASRGISRVSVDYRIPIGFGVLTCDSVRQAEQRAGGDAGNKGWEAALAALEMALLVDRLRGERP